MSESDANGAAGFVSRRNPPAMLNATEIGNSQINVAEPGRLAFVAGQTATPPDGGPIPPDLASQSRLVAKQLEAALQELGASAHNMVAFRLSLVGTRVTDGG